jgi:CubicO group peptidase (beta-lactamase class C family)
VTGATLGVLQGGEIATAASGLLNMETRVEATPDSVFQIGSIGKVFTTTLIMQLADEGRLSLDDKVIAHLKDFTLAETKAARSVTIRQTLNHTSGMDGDFFPADDPEGPSTLSYVRKMALLPSLYPPGEGPMAYCNSGFVVAGRIVEVLTGLPWQTAVLERICKPLGLSHVVAYPHETLRYRCAIGHIADPKDMTKIRMAPHTFLSLSAAAAGAVLSMSVESVLKFAAVHMANGAYGDGKSLLSVQSAQRMQTDITPIPLFSRVGMTHWGLGWFGCDGHGYRMVGHDGATFGQFAYLRTFPDKNIAFALFTNSPSAKLYDAIEAQLMDALLGTPVAPQPPQQSWTPDPALYVGRYANIGAIYDVSEKDGALALCVKSKLGAPDVQGRLEPYREDVFALQALNTPADGQKISFHEGTGPRIFIRIGLRMGRRTQ